MVDYRAESYKEIAKKKSDARRGYQQFPTEGGKVGSASGDVLITEGTKAERLGGGISVNTVFQSSPTTTTVNDSGQLVKESATSSQVLTQSQSSYVSPRALEIFTGQRPSAKVSGGIGAKLARESNRPMSIRDDEKIVYKVSPQKRDKFKYNYSSSNVKQDKENGSNTNYIGSLSRSPSNAQSREIQRKTSEQEFYENWQKDAEERSQRLDEVFKGKAGDSFLEKTGRETLKLPATIITELPEQLALKGYGRYLQEKEDLSKEGYNLKGRLKRGLNTAIFDSPPAQAIKIFNPTTPKGIVALATLPLGLKSSSPNVKLVSSDVALRQTSTSTGVLSEGKVFGTVETSSRSFGVFPVKKTFEVRGDVVESGRVSSVTGLKSGEPVVNTVGSADLQVTSGGVSQRVSSSSVGQEVGGFGNRRITLQTSGKESSFVEKYAGVSKDDTIFGGGVSKKGVNFFVGKKQLEVSGNKIGEARYFNPETGLESATPTLNLRQESVPTTVKVFGIKSASQPEISGNAVITRRGVTERLLSEKREFDIGNVEPGVVSAVAREQATSGAGVETVLSSKSPDMLSGGFSSGELLVKSVEVVQPKSAVVPPIVFNSGNVAVGESVVINDQKQMSTASQYAGGAFDMGEVSFSIVSSSSKPISDVSVVNVIGSSTKDRLVKKDKLDIGSVQDSANVQSAISSSTFSSKNVNAVEFKSAQIFDLSPQSSLKSVYRSSSIPNIRSAIEFQSNKLSPTFNVSTYGGRGVFGVEVRRRGVFKEVGRGLSEEDAFKLGAARVSGSAAATFRVTKGGTPIAVSKPLGASFYRKGTSIIEKPGRRIKSLGELQEITYAGIRSQRSKGVRVRL